MKIVIVENELYLAQSIAAKLGEFRFETEIFSTVHEAMESLADVYLLSTSLPGQNFLPLIEKFRDKNIILMVNYINNDTVGEPLKLGARDYIVKPFMIEELIRKIEHYHRHRLLQERERFFQEFFDDMFARIDTRLNPGELPVPSVIRTNYRRIVDKLVLEMSLKDKNILHLIPLDREGWKDRLASMDPEHIAYLPHLEKLKKPEREALFTLLEGKRFIVCDVGGEVETPFETLELRSKNKLFDQNEILTIDEYVQHVIRSFQYRYPDTELSKKLGISRKSLWEKRKKYELFKKK